MGEKRAGTYHRVARDLIERLGKGGEGVKPDAFTPLEESREPTVEEVREYQASLRELQQALHAHYRHQKPPVRINKATAATLLGVSEASVENRRHKLGYDEKAYDYDYDLVCKDIQARPHVAVGEYAIALVDGVERVVALVGPYTGGLMAFADALALGAVVKRMPIEKALLMPWADPTAKALWRESYLRVFTQMSEEADRSD